jgi:hypothetical protein
MTGGDKQLATDFAGYFTNTMLQGKGAEDLNTAYLNARDKYEKAGIKDAATAKAGIQALVEQGKITQDEATAFNGGIDTVFGSQPATPANGGQNQGANNRRPEAKPKPKQPRRERAVSIADIMPTFSAVPTMPEPDDEQTPEEKQSVTNFREMFENFARKRSGYQ